jgi:hypothetical protein
MFVNLAIRAVQWRTRPPGRDNFGNAFARPRWALPPARCLRAGQVIRPYFLARHERISAWRRDHHPRAAVDRLAVLALPPLSSPSPRRRFNPALFAAVMWGARRVVALAAGPRELSPTIPARWRTPCSGSSGRRPRPRRMIGRMVQFASGLGTIGGRRLFVALAWSFPLWLSIDAGIWAVAVAFGFDVPFTGSFLIVPLLTLGVAVPTPGAIGGFHEAFRLGVTVF